MYDYIQSHTLPCRLILLLYIHNNPKYFPINELRNLAIRNIETSHFVVLDSDLMVSGCSVNEFSLDNSYDELMMIPESIHSRTDSAVILPVFFYNEKLMLKHCNTIENCTQLLN